MKFVGNQSLKSIPFLRQTLAVNRFVEFVAVIVLIGLSNQVQTMIARMVGIDALKTPTGGILRVLTSESLKKSVQSLK